MPVQKYSKLPVVIEAIQFLGAENAQEVMEFLGGAGYEYVQFDAFEHKHLRIKTLEGIMECPIGWYIIRGLEGEYYPCREDIFKASHTPYIEPTNN